MKFPSVNTVSQLLILCCLPLMAFAEYPVEKHELEDCLSEKILTAPDHMTAGEMRAFCRKLQAGSVAAAEAEAQETDAVERRMTVDEGNILRPFTIMAHRQNYFLLASHNFQGYSERGYAGVEDNENFSSKRTEAHFQLSVKTPLAADLFNSNTDVFAAYTMRSFWQIYLRDASSPFRETNHEPELWLQAHPDFEILGFRNTADVLGIVHQSNGQSGNLSRSWNRIYADFIFHRGNFALSIKPWVRFEIEEDDDNPDITDYLGHGELRLAYQYDDHTFTLMSRNNMESGFSRGAVQLGWSFPLFRYPYLKGYVQYFSGYGESLIDYDNYVNRIGAGIMFNDLL